MNQAVRTENLVKRFRAVEALRGLDIEVPKNSIYALVGPNDAGKTTALKIMMNPLSQWGPVAVIVGGYLLGIYFQNRRIDDLRDSINRRFDDVNKRFDDLRDLLKSEIKRVEERIDRLEHPIVH
jgi:ATPase subunit of ABC transporter with duplicated ATPase domains